MITALELHDFKNFEEETLRVGPFTVIVGANASGKSNIRDAFRILHGIGRGYTLADIMGGKYGAGGHVEWEQIRGAASEINRFEKYAFALAVRMAPTNGAGQPDVRYLIALGATSATQTGFQVIEEHLTSDPYEPIYTSNPFFPSDRLPEQDDDRYLSVRMAKTGNQRRLGRRVSVRSDQPALTQIPDVKRIVRAHKDQIQAVIDLFANMRFLDLSPARIRQPSFPGQTILGDSGENLPTVLRELCADPERRETLTEWTRELTPMDIRDFEFPVDPISGRVQLLIRDANGRKVSAYSASDGTLRFLAILAALLGTDPARLYFFEEIDNGIHPSRMRLLLDLIEGQTAKGGTQVVTTTHSPDLLGIVGDRTFQHTSVVCRLPDTTDAIIRPVSELHKATELRESQGLGRLHTSGWMEDALAFTEARRTDDEQPT